MSDKVRYGMKLYIKASKDQFDTKNLKDYKGYEIQKAWWIDSDGERIKKYPIFYLVADGDDYIGDEYPTLDAAKKFIDTL